jgi:general stress protein 26
VALKAWGGRHLTREEIASLLTEAKIARFCSLNEDGTIHVAPVWFKYEQEALIIVTPARSRKVRNVRHNTKVSLLVDVSDPQNRGVLIYGTAEIAELRREADIQALALSIGEKYMPAEQIKAQWRVICPPATRWAKITVMPERMTSFNYPE